MLIVATTMEFRTFQEVHFCTILGAMAGGLASLLEAVPPTLKLMFLAQVRLFGESYQTSWELSRGPWWNSWLRVRS